MNKNLLNIVLIYSVICRVLESNFKFLDIFAIFLHVNTFMVCAALREKVTTTTEPYFMIVRIRTWPIFLSTADFN